MSIRLKESLLTMTFVVASTFNAMADKDVAINVSELPAEAQKVLSVNFADSKVALSKKETDFLSKSYEVIFTNGNKIEFDSNGRWEKISCERGGIPSALIPSFIVKYVAEHYEQTQIVEIERDKRGFEVELSNGIDLEFDRKGRCVNID